MSKGSLKLFCTDSVDFRLAALQSACDRHYTAKRAPAVCKRRSIRMLYGRDAAVDNVVRCVEIQHVPVKGVRYVG